MGKCFKINKSQNLGYQAIHCSSKLKNEKWKIKFLLCKKFVSTYFKDKWTLKFSCANGLNNEFVMEEEFENLCAVGL